jgi:EAL domain-containing protein (putative c-di-GMP-specific phosphodiesterase class I)
MKRADTAMYQAKSAGRNTLRFFDPEMQAAVTSRAALESQLRSAINHQQFAVYYQPQVDGARQVVGVEALIRWMHPDRGVVLPGEFIPLAEDTGLILPLGDWILEAACQQLKTWALAPETAQLSIAVNVSARQFRQTEFVDRVLGLMDRWGTPAGRLKLELTESMLLDNTTEIIAKMGKLKARGVSFSLDDFGTGYSSLSYLKLLPIDQLKIDQSFVHDVLNDPNAATIACSIIALAHSLGLMVIAEGVETQEQSDFLARNGCDHCQGYLFGKPLALPEFEAQLYRR